MPLAMREPPQSTWRSTNRPSRPGFASVTTERASTNAPTQGYGLRIMRERAAAIGGRFRLVTEPGDGTMVEVKVP